MAEIKVSQLPEASGINDADLLMIVQGGVNKKITKENCQFASGDEISIGTIEPTEDEKLWIKSDETTNQARYRDGNTFKELSIKALDSMPVGTQVEYTGTDIPNGWEQANDYSTTEINTGKKWVDGKPIYRKIVEYTLTDDSAVYPSFDTGILNVDNMFIKIELQYGSNNRYISGITTFNGYFDKQTGYFSFNRSNSDATKAPVGKYTFVFEYTKTTD